MTAPKTKLVRRCSIWTALDLLGDKPTLLILEAYWLGTRTFSEFCDTTGLLKTVVSHRLNRLVETSCMQRVPYSKSPKRYQYIGTEKLLSVYPIALSMLFWEQKWAADPRKVSVELRCLLCDNGTAPTPKCSHCRTTIQAGDVEWRDGPGAGYVEADYQRRRNSQNKREPRPTELFDLAAEIIGDRWSVLIIRSLFEGKSSFKQLGSDTQMASSTLARRLKWLTAAHIVSKPDPNTEKSKDYSLTARGQDLYPILLSLMQWGDRWYNPGAKRPILRHHKVCDQQLSIALICSACDREVNFRDISFLVTEPSS